MTDMTMTCARLDELLPDYLEGTLDAAARELIESHLAGCARCAALVGDLNDIRAEARALPALRPSRDLWSGIEARIEAPPEQELSSRGAVAATPVVSLESRRIERRSWSAGWLAAAAAALVAVSSGVTYTLTRPTHVETQVASSKAASPVAATTESLTTVEAAPSTLSTAQVPPAAEPRETSASAPRLVRNNGQRSSSPNDAAFDQEIASLRRVVRQRESKLDPATVRELRRNLDIIDNAIAQSRAALQRDPASGFLNERLNNVLGKKVELLRTAALLPART